MQTFNPPTHGQTRPGLLLASILPASCLFVLLVLFFSPRPLQNRAAPGAAASTGITSPPMRVIHSGRGLSPRQTRLDLPASSARPAEEIVAEKLSQFASQRQEIVAAMARHFNVPLPEDVDRFFAAVHAGRWEETTNLYAILSQRRASEDCPPGLAQLWPALHETFGVAEQAHEWPAQNLLDYGNAVLDSLRPGMAYIGGTDAGRFIPTLLTDTGEGEPHIVLTQNALANGTYLEYLKFRYGERLATLTSDESQSSFATYIADAEKRFQHDQQFPEAPKQVRPGEDIQITDGRVAVSGQIAVMAINEHLLQTLLQKNPDLTFALEESSPLKSLYAGATTLGPITELRATDPASALTAERAAQALDYWRTTTQNLLAEPDAAAAAAPRDAYLSLILGQAHLFLDRNLSGEAEQAYQLAHQLSPDNLAVVFGYTGLLVDQQRYEEARQVAQAAANLVPDNNQLSDLLHRLHGMK